MVSGSISLTKFKVRSGPLVLVVPPFDLLQLALVLDESVDLVDEDGLRLGHGILDVHDLLLSHLTRKLWCFKMSVFL